METIVAGQSNETSPTIGQGEKYLNRCVIPHLNKQKNVDFIYLTPYMFVYKCVCMCVCVCVLVCMRM